MIFIIDRMLLRLAIYDKLIRLFKSWKVVAPFLFEPILFYMSNYYRKIWEDAYGPIPKDDQGRSYEIHHIDGNRNNNELSNLMCVSIEDHIKIHTNQGDL